MMDIRRNAALKAMWWDSPELPSLGSRVSRRKAEELSESTEILKVKVQLSKDALGRFLPSKKWKPYSWRGIDAGYICPLYTLREVGYRYGLSQNTRRHWRKYVLPDPISIVMRRGIRAHHWSKVQLIVLDEILLHLEKNGIMKLTRRNDDVIDLLHYGCVVVEKYYKEKYETLPLTLYDSHGVSFG